MSSSPCTVLAYHILCIVTYCSVIGQMLLLLLQPWNHPVREKFAHIHWCMYWSCIEDTSKNPDTWWTCKQVAWITAFVGLSVRTLAMLRSTRDWLTLLPALQSALEDRLRQWAVDRDRGIYAIACVHTWLSICALNFCLKAYNAEWRSARRTIKCPKKRLKELTPPLPDHCIYHQPAKINRTRLQYMDPSLFSLPYFCAESLGWFHCREDV